MASINMRVRCGCGYKPESLEEALTHAEENVHTMDIMGKVVPSPDAIQAKRVVSREYIRDETS